MQSVAQSPKALEAWGALFTGAREPGRFARAGVDALAARLGSDLTTLSDCDLITGRRRVLGDSGHPLAPDALAAFDRHFRAHPLIGFHAHHPRGGTHRISDSLSRTRFRRTPLYGEYYQLIGIRYAVAVPLYVDGTRIVSFVLNRSRRDFDDDECAELDFLRGPLSTLFRQVTETARLQREATLALAELDHVRLTPREAEIIQWVAAGKTDRQIAAIVDASTRTVQKHLQHVYTKLGVESRTAAVMRCVRSRGLGAA